MYIDSTENHQSTSAYYEKIDGKWESINYRKVYDIVNEFARWLNTFMNKTKRYGFHLVKNAIEGSDEKYADEIEEMYSSWYSIQNLIEKSCDFSFGFWYVGSNHRSSSE